MPTSPTLIWATLGTILLVCLINALIPAHPSLQTALTLLRTTPVHLTPSESSSIKRHLLNQHAHSTPSHFTPAPAVIPESIRLRNHLNLPPSLTPQQVTSTLHSTLHSTLSRFLTSDDDDDTLTHANTEPLKIHVNWGNMFEDTTKPYTTCFNADDWSFTGAMNPHHPPPNNLPEYPVCNTATYDVFASDNTACWHQCTPSDVLTTARLDFLKANVEKAVASVEQIYRVPTMTKALIFAMGDMAAFNNDVLEWGDQYDAVCSAATFGFCDTLLPTSFCTSGVPDGGNVVLNMVYKPTMWGGGTGGSCEFDETGRPISIGFWNHLSLKDAITSLDALGKDTAYKNEYLVGFATHEINHGLGFNIGQFLQANIVERRDVYSEPNEKGVKEDALWHFKVDTRMSKLAQVHYDCFDDAKWHGVPLMGAVEKGRDSHQNSFVMIEDVESYGTFEKNLPFTLAAMEDTGHYLANYSVSEFPNWGAYQGCDFVNTRCRTRANDDAVYEKVGNDKECSRDFKMSGDSKYDKCARVNCGSKSSCHPECVMLTSDNREEYLKVRPVMNGTGAFLGSPKASGMLGKFSDFLNSDLFQLVLPVIVWIGTALLLCCLRKMCCSSEKGAIHFSHMVAAVFLFFGVAVMGVAGYMFYFKEVFEDAISISGMIGIGCFGFLIALQSVLQWFTAVGTNKFMFKVSGFIGTMMLLVQFTLAMWIILYNYSLEEVQQATQGGGKWDDHFMAPIMKPVESYLCESYRNCCQDPVLSEQDDYVCVSSHEGTTSSLQSDINDPSRDMFCEYVSGMKSVGLGAARGMGEAACGMLEDVVQGFDREMCQSEYCAGGVKGYEDFLTLVLSCFRRNFNYIGGVFFVLMIVQLEQMRILRELYNLHNDSEKEEEEEGGGRRRGKSGKRKSTSARSGSSGSHSHGHSHRSGRRQSGGRRSSAGRHQAALVSTNRWACEMCTLVNPADTSECSACHNPYMGVEIVMDDNML